MRLSVLLLACVLPPCAAYISPQRPKSWVRMAAGTGDLDAVNVKVSSPVGGMSKGARSVKVVIPADTVAKKRRKVKQKHSRSAQTRREAAAVAAPESSATDASEVDMLEQLHAGQLAANRAQATKADFGKALTAGFRENLFLVVALPAITAGFGGYLSFKRYQKWSTERSQKLVANYAREMMLNEGNFDTLRRLHADYLKKLGGKKKRDAMVFEYFGKFFAERGVNSEHIKSFAFFVSLHGLSDFTLADLLAEYASELTERGNLALKSKMYFIGSKLIKDPEALEILDEIKTELTKKSFYGNAEMFARSMNELAKAAVRDVVEDLAKEFWPNPVTTENAEEMRPGVEAEAKIMGLSTEEVNALLQEAVDGRNIIADMYGGSGEMEKRKKEEEEAGGAGGISSSVGKTGVGLIATCQQCGHTLFVAPGREAKFFGDDMTCPSCGAPKDQFKVRK